MSVTDITGSLATPDMIELIQRLYADIPLVKDLVIKIKGDPAKVAAFLEFCNQHPDHFESIGCEPPTFVISDDSPHEITLGDLEEQFSEIMIHYV